MNRALPFPWRDPSARGRKSSRKSSAQAVETKTIKPKDAARATGLDLWRALREASW
jgi:hypothetical protein